MKKYNYFGRVSGWGICMLFLLTGLFAGCSENEEDYPKGQRPAGIESVRKVACIGNSITYGARQFLNDREKECYPALLGNMLGEGFEVANFGCSGTTLLKNGNSPYWNTKEYTNAKAFLPNIVIVKLGSNDSKSGNWSSHGSEFESDLTDLVLSLRSLSTRPRVFLCTPAIAYSNSFGIDDGYHNERNYSGYSAGCRSSESHGHRFAYGFAGVWRFVS